MPPTALSPTRPAPGGGGIDVRLACLTWMAIYLGGNLLGGIVLGATHQSTGSGAPAWVSVVSALCLWAPMLGGLWYVSRRFATGSFTRDYGLAFRTVDLIGIPVGVLSQLVVLRLLYWPLEQAWPGTFARKHVEKSAKDLYDSAHGGWLVALVLVVVIGAPFVEELIYRGLLQGAFTRRFNDWLGVVVVAAWFAIVHFQPIEYPGLFVFGLVLGICALRTGRLGMGMLAHIAFNATGLALVAGR